MVATRQAVLGTIQLKDIVKGGLADRFERFRAMGIRTVMITGDNPLTAAAIAKGGGSGRLPGRSETGRQARALSKRTTHWPPGRHDRVTVPTMHLPWLKPTLGWR